MKQLKALFIIVNANHADEIITLAREQGARGATILNARGSAPKHEVFMGITIDTEKDIILILTDEKVCNDIMSSVKEKAGIGTSAHGVCFALPIDKVVGLNVNTDDKE